MDEQLYYWAWSESDNVGVSYFTSAHDRMYRVWRVNTRGRDEAVTDPMPKLDAIRFTTRIVKLTGGRILS